MLSYGSVSYGYTANGSLTFKADGSDTTWYNYDNLGNLISVLLPDGTFIEYLIDGQNRRIGKKVNGEFKEGWIYQSQLDPIAEFDSTGQLITQFVYGTKGNIPDYMIKNDITYRIISDHLGSVRLIINPVNGQIVQSISYDEFGDILTNSNPDFQPFVFAGGIYDNDTKLIRFGKRDYDTKIGRWLTKDPIGFIGGLYNLYLYTSNDPINFTDPSGLLKLYTSFAAPGQIERFNRALNILRSAIKDNNAAKDYFNKFGIDIEEILDPCKNEGPMVFLKYHAGAANVLGYYNGFIINHIVLSNMIDIQLIASTLVHELGHWANDVGDFWGDLNPDISDVPSFDNPNPKDGPYGYAAEIVTFGRIQ